LKLAAMVRESRRAKRAKVTGGTGRGATGLNSFVKCASFHRHNDRFVADVAANLAVPCVVAWEGAFVTVEEAVSIRLAER
jgi:hypothetical protein